MRRNPDRRGSPPGLTTSLGGMAAKRAERLVNLVIALLSTHQYVTAARIRATVPGYESDDGSERADEAFKRMFERDKAELREMGVPLETGRTSAFDTEDGYRIARAHYELPEIQLTGDEAAAVGLALRLWESAQLADAAHGALVKLKAAGIDVDSSRAIPLQPRLDAGEPAFEPCYAAARDRRHLTFDYQRPDEDAPVRRHVQPWGVVAWHGRWYLVGLDLDRGAERVFRLSRVVGTPKASGPAGAFEPPVDLDLAEVVAGQVGGAEHLVVVRARPGTAIGLRRHATPLGGADDGDDRLQLRTTEPGRLADQIAAYGADVLVESPAEFRDAVISRLTRLAGMVVPA
jgi:proteasome accessory factor B